MTKRGTLDQIPGFDKERDPQPAEEALCGDSLGKQEGKDEPSFRVNHCEKPDPRSDLRCLSVLSVLNFSRHTFFFHKSLDQTLAACKSKMKHSQVNADVCKIPKDFLLSTDGRRRVSGLHIPGSGIRQPPGIRLRF